MMIRSRLLVPALVLLAALLAAVTLSPAIARADSLFWTTTYVGPDNIPNGESEPIPVAAAFNAVDFSDAQRGWAVGVRINYGLLTETKPLVAFTSNAGVTWAPVSTVGTITVELNGVFAFSETDVWVAGNSGTLAHFDGLSWTKRTVPGWTSTKAFRGITFADPLNGWAVGDGLGVARTVDGGDTWTLVTAPGTSGVLRAVAPISGSTAIAVGDSGAMRSIVDGVAAARYSGTGNNLYGIAFGDATHGWAVGDSATFVTTSDGGANWSSRAVTLPVGYTTFDIRLRSVAFSGPLNGIAVGTYQFAWRTTDGGLTWRPAQVPGGLGDYELRGIAFTAGSADVPVAVGRGFALQMSSDAYKARAYRGTWARPDTTAPVTSVDAQGTYVGPASIHLTAADEIGGSGVAHTYWKLDAGPLRTDVFTVDVTAPGAHQLEYWSVDTSANVETHKWADFEIVVPDTTPPVTTSDAVASYIGPATIRLTATDVSGSGVAHTYYVLDGAEQVEGLRVTEAAAGPHTLEFWSVDVAGNPESPHVTVGFTITIPDTTPPTTISDARVSYGSTATIVLTATDEVGGSGVAHTYYRLDGSAVATDVLSLEVWAPGAHTLEFWSVDVAGNPETPHKSATFSVIEPPVPDTTAPTTVSDAVASYVGPATIRLTATDALGGSGVAHTYWQLDGGAWNEGTTAYAATAGPHTLLFWSIDVAGNPEGHKSASFTVTIPDTIAPVTVSNAVASYLWSASIRLTATDSGGSGVATTYYRLDSGAQTPYTTTLTVTAGGSHTLEFWSVDVAGNPESPHKTATFIVTEPPPALDTVAPTTSWSGQAATFDLAATVTLTATDGDGTGVGTTYYRLDGGAQRTYTLPLAVAGGSHTLEYWSVDVAGNTESPHKSAAFMVRTKAKVYGPYAPTSAVRNRSFTVYGYVAPAHGPSTYYLASLRFYLRDSRGTYRYHHSVNARRYYYWASKTKYKASVKLPHAGRWRVRAVHEDSGHVASYSSYDYLTVR